MSESALVHPVSGIEIPELVSPQVKSLAFDPLQGFLWVGLLGFKLYRRLEIQVSRRTLTVNQSIQSRGTVLEL